jgi:DHA1 family multidrug resistance protein-like MFS transporter
VTTEAPPGRPLLERLPRVLRGPLGPLLEYRQLLLISIATVLVMAGQGVISPVLPLFAAKFGVGSAAIGLTLSSFALARLILNIPLGILSDRYGRRLLLVSGPLVTGIGMVGSGFAVGIVDLLAWRFVAGAGSAMYMTGAQIYLTDISNPTNRARFIGTNQGALLLGVSIGPAVGGLLAEFWGLRAPFIVTGIAALFAMVHAYFKIPETRHLALAQIEAARKPTTPGGAAPVTPKFEWFRFATSRDFVAISVVVMAIFLTRTAGKQTLLPLYAAENLDMSPGVLGAIFTVMAVINIVLLAPAAVIADKYGRKWSIVPSSLVVAVSMFMLASAGGYSMFLAGALVHAVGSSLAGPAPAAYTADIAPANLRGLAMGMFRTSGDVGFVLGPPLLGALADATSFGWGLAANGVIMAVACLWFLVIARETIGRKAVERAEAAG